MKKLLLITYHFPPDAEVGGVRPYQLARLLPEFGIETHVLTVEPAFAESPDPGYQPDDIPPNRIIRAGVKTTLRDRALRLWRASPASAAGAQVGRHGYSSQPGSPAGQPRSPLRSWALEWLAFPDLRYGWYEPALRAGERLLAAERFDLVLSTSPPRVTHMVASRLASRHRIPWVMDLRDPWHDSGATPVAGTAMLTRLHRRLFSRYLPQAALIVTNTEPLRHYLERSLGQHARRIACVPNGLDPALCEPSVGKAQPKPFSIGHFGQMPGRRSAHTFLEGLRRWLDSRPSEADRITVRFIGSEFAGAQRVAESLHLTGVSFQPRVPRVEVPGLLAEQYILLALANDQPLQVPGKVYEYLAASRRILACTERDSATADLLSPAPGCVIAEDPEAVANALERWWSEHSSGADAYVDRSALLASMTYLRRAEQFSELLREVTRLSGE